MLLLLHSAPQVEPPKRRIQNTEVKASNLVCVCVTVCEIFLCVQRRGVGHENRKFLFQAGILSEDSTEREKTAGGVFFKMRSSEDSRDPSDNGF